MATLTPIEQDDFEVFLEHEIVEYAQDKVKICSDHALLTQRWFTLSDGCFPGYSILE